MKQDFFAQSYLAQYGGYVPVSGFKEEKEEEASEAKPEERKKRIFTNWAEVNAALENYDLNPGDEMHESSGDVYSVTTIRRFLDDDNEVISKYEYEKIN